MSRMRTMLARTLIKSVEKLLSKLFVPVKYFGSMGLVDFRDNFVLTVSSGFIETTSSM